MNIDQIKKKYLSAYFHPILITEVTRMNGGYFCVAAWDIYDQRIVRPLQINGDNWRLEHGGFQFVGNFGKVDVGYLMNCQPSDNIRGIPPHSNEDFPLTCFPTLLESFDEEQTYQLMINKTDDSILSIFGRQSVDGKYLVEGTNSRSLGSVSIPRRKICFFEDNFGRLRLRLHDSDEMLYSLPVTSDQLLRFFSHSADGLEENFGVDEANELLEANAPDQHLILRIGLARGWGGPGGNWNPKRCYIQLNGIIFPSDNWVIFSG